MGKVYILGHKGFIGKNVLTHLGRNELVLISREDFKKIK
jgi:nucleoside-diphosphate-sugar epimerase